MSTAIQLFHGTTDDLLMLAEANGVVVSKSESRAIVTGAGTRIGQIPDGELSDNIGTMLYGLFRMLGIHKEPDEFDGTQFMEDLQEYFEKMTLADVKHAFKAYIMGDLDGNLPKDSKGRVVQHYQSFAPVFYVPILKAYRAYQADAKKRVSDQVEGRLLLAAANDRDPVNDCCDLLLRLKETAVEVAKGESPSYLLGDTAEGALKWCGIIPEEFEVAPVDVQHAKMRLTRGRDSSVSLSIANMMKDGAMPDNMRIAARVCALRRLFREGAEKMGPERVAGLFDELITKYREQSNKPAANATP